MVDVILLETVAGLGKAGEKVTVKPGFARNFLLPQAKALAATKANVAAFEAKRAELEKDIAEKETAAKEVATKLEKVSLSFERQASETGFLYGSVKSTDIINELSSEGVKLSRSQVEIPNPIKEIGDDHFAMITLYGDVVVKLPIVVSRPALA